MKNVSCYKFTIHILCVSTYFPGLCTAESVHTEGGDWKGNYPRRQAGFPYLPRMSWILWLCPTRTGSEREIPGEQAGRGRVLLLTVRLFCFIFFYFYIRLCFYKSSQSFQSNSVSPALVLGFFSFLRYSHICFCFYISIKSIKWTVSVDSINGQYQWTVSKFKNSNANREQVR